MVASGPSTTDFKCSRFGTGQLSHGHPMDLGWILDPNDLSPAELGPIGLDMWGLGRAVFDLELAR